MKKSTTALRLKEYMSENNLKQVDIINRAEPFCKEYGIKLTKPDLSQYISGKTEPGQNKLFILARALNVSEAWLMGFDVPRTRITKQNGGGWAGCNYYNQFISTDDVPLDEEKNNIDILKQQLIDNYENLNQSGKEKLIDYSNDLVSSGNYTKSNT